MGQNQLGWKPGQFGKGLIGPDGAVTTWVTTDKHGSPHHSEIAQDMYGQGQVGPARTAIQGFFIEPSGQVEPDMFCDDITPALKADPQLRGDSEWDFNGTRFDEQVQHMASALEPWKPGEYGKGIMHTDENHEHPPTLLTWAVHTPKDWTYSQLDPADGNPSHSQVESMNNFLPLAYMYINPDGAYEWSDEDMGEPFNKLVPLQDPRLKASKDQWHVGSMNKTADKLNDFLLNPKARPDLQTPEAQSLINNQLGLYYHGPRTDPMMPWLVREWKKGRLQHNEFREGPALSYSPNPAVGTQHLSPAELQHWADWYHSDHPTRRGVDIMQMKLPEMHDKISEWDKAMAEQAGHAAKSSGPVVHQLPGGYTVQRLESPEALKEEGEAMGHCVGGYHNMVENGRTSIYSLRDEQNVPHVTAEIRPEKYMHKDGTVTGSHRPDAIPLPHNGTVQQIQGKGNTIPKPEYQAMMKDYFDTIPEGEKPQWHNTDIDDYDQLDEAGGFGGGYQAHGDYGLNENEMHYDWQSICSSVLDYLDTEDWSADEKGANIVEAAKEHCKTPQEWTEFKQAANSAESDAYYQFERDFDERYSTHDPDEAMEAIEQYTGLSFDPDEAGVDKEDFVEKEDPECDCDDEGGEDCNGSHEEGEGEFDEYAYDQALNDAKERFVSDHLDDVKEYAWEESAHKKFSDELSYGANYGGPKADDGGNDWHQARNSRNDATTHKHFSTNEPCQCRFTDHHNPHVDQSAVPFDWNLDA